MTCTDSPKRTATLVVVSSTPCAKPSIGLGAEQPTLVMSGVTMSILVYRASSTAPTPIYLSVSLGRPAPDSKRGKNK